MFYQNLLLQSLDGSTDMGRSWGFAASASEETPASESDSAAWVINETVESDDEGVYGYDSNATS